jgi:hypothetical protein
MSGRGSSYFAGRKVLIECSLTTIHIDRASMFKFLNTFNECLVKIQKEAFLGTKGALSSIII